MPTTGNENDDPLDDDFDFLSEEGTGSAAPKKNAGDIAPHLDQTLNINPPAKLPVIRQPVPISQSGPNLSPAERLAQGSKPRAHPTAAANQTTDDVDEDFGFLDETHSHSAQAQAKVLPPVKPVSVGRSSKKEFGQDWNEGIHDYEENAPRRKPLWLALAGLGVLTVAGLVAFQSGLFNSGAPNSSADNTTRSNETATDAAGQSSSNAGSSVAELFRSELARIEGLVANGEFESATAAIDGLDTRVFGYGQPEFTALREQIQARDTGDALEAEKQRLAAEAVLADQERVAEEERLAAETARAREAEDVQLAAEAERARQATEARLAIEAEQAREATEARLALEAAQARQAEEARLAAEAEKERLATEARLAAEAEQARQAEQVRLAAEAEQERLATEARQAAEAEQERLATEARQAAEAEEERLAEEARQAAEAEQERLAEEARLAAEAEQERLATEARQAAEAEARAATEARLAEEARAEEARLAADARIAEEAERLAAERRAEEARQQAAATRRERERLEAVAAEQRANARRAAADRAAQRSGQTAAPVAPSVNDQEATDRLASAATRSAVVQRSGISDAEISQIDSRLQAVKEAIRARNMTRLTALTNIDGSRVQAFYQLFTNSSQIDIRVDGSRAQANVGIVVGTLQISRVLGNDGTARAVPSNLRNFTLTTRREGNEWSKFSW